MRSRRASRHAWALIRSRNGIRHLRRSRGYRTDTLLPSSYQRVLAFVRRHRSLLASRPVWLFSSGPLGTETTDAQGRDVREASEPREFAEFRDAVHPRDQRVFFGAYDPDSKAIGFMERFTRMMPAARAAMPGGDFRDWAEIEAWAAKIADELTLVPAGSR